MQKSYNEVLETIFALPKGHGSRGTLTNIQKLCESHNQPQNTFPSIHVAGTNGKGSVCTKIAAVLQKAGYTVGLYTSPHISTFRERIQISNKLISEEEVAALFNKIQTADIPTNFFEIATLLAFLHFRNQKVDVAVIETGLGGRWDATNVIQPLLSIITSIGYDHIDILGSSLEEIAYEKAGIIKSQVPVVLGPDVPTSFMQKIAKEQNAPLYQSRFQSEDFDLENQETARLALSLLTTHFSIPQEALKELCQKPFCRFERHFYEKEIIFDVAHNAHGFARLLQQLENRYPNHSYRFIVGFSKGKEISKCACLIESKATAIHLVSHSHYRLASVDEIKTAFSPEKITLEKTIAQGVQNALKAESTTPEVLIITGSFFIMEEARKALGIMN